MNLKTTRDRGEYPPPFYYGYTYENFNKQKIYYHIIPINFMIRFYLWIKYLWDVFRLRKAKREIEMLFMTIEKYKMKRLQNILFEEEINIKSKINDKE